MSFILYKFLFNFAMNSFSGKFKPKCTLCMDSGANPGMITHFCILGIYSLAKSAIERGVSDSKKIKELLDKKDLSGLAEQLQIDVIHISEYLRMRINGTKPLRTVYWKNH